MKILNLSIVGNTGSQTKIYNPTFPNSQKTQTDSISTETKKSLSRYTRSSDNPFPRKVGEAKNLFDARGKLDGLEHKLAGVGFDESSTSSNQQSTSVVLHYDKEGHITGLGTSKDEGGPSLDSIHINRDLNGKLIPGHNVSPKNSIKAASTLLDKVITRYEKEVGHLKNGIAKLKEELEKLGSKDPRKKMDLEKTLAQSIEEAKKHEQGLNDLKQIAQDFKLTGITENKDPASGIKTVEIKIPTDAKAKFSKEETDLAKELGIRLNGIIVKIHTNKETGVQATEVFLPNDPDMGETKFRILNYDKQLNDNSPYHWTADGGPPNRDYKKTSGLMRKLLENYCPDQLAQLDPAVREETLDDFTRIATMEIIPTDVDVNSKISKLNAAQNTVTTALKPEPKPPITQVKPEEIVKAPIEETPVASAPTNTASDRTALTLSNLNSALKDIVTQLAVVMGQKSFDQLLLQIEKSKKETKAHLEKDKIKEQIVAILKSNQLPQGFAALLPDLSSESNINTAAEIISNYFFSANDKESI